MLALAIVLLIVGVLLVIGGFVLFANGIKAAPHRRTDDDPTGVKRATARTSWPDIFRYLPTSVRLLRGHEASHEEKLAAAGSVLVVCGIGALCVAIVSTVIAFM